MQPRRRNPPLLPRGRRASARHDHGLEPRRQYMDRNQGDQISAARHREKRRVGAEMIEDEARIFRHQHPRSEEHTSELQSLIRNSYAVFCLKNKTETADPQRSKTKPTQK